ncbi:hypothetical protein [Aliikangiella sp. G2MR2-5]|uniref:hypothetical protein n=1 Tax=Aliikangiella sp. G2MR2-5 TaxID=2788943 RepID=UPI0018A9D3CA|nr:hypothetical protein [Aliikangiella sp. G2MR2-5]
MSTQDTYTVLLSGSLNGKYPAKIAHGKLAALFKLSQAEISSLLAGAPKEVKSGLSHQQAYKYQQMLKATGFEASLLRVPAIEKSAEFSLVPEGEENTPYRDLLKKYNDGEIVECKKCGVRQPLMPYCQNCGKQLVPVKVNHEEKPTNKPPTLIYAVLLLTLLLGLLIAYLWLY